MKIEEYRKKNSIELIQILKDNRMGIMRSYGMMGKRDSKGTEIKGTAKEGVARRIRKENAKILTILNERRA